MKLSSSFILLTLFVNHSLFAAGAQAPQNSCVPKVSTSTLEALVRRYVPEGNDGLDASSVIYVSDSKGKIVQSLFEKKPHRYQAIASTQKILTAYTAFKLGSMNAKATFLESDLFYDAQGNRAKHQDNVTTVQVGQSLTLSAWMRTLIFQSSNGAGFALARGSAGNVRSFMGKMNEEALKILGTSTRSYFQNPAGLTDSDSDYRFAPNATVQKSSPHDLAQIAATIMADSGFRSALEKSGIAGAQSGYLYKLGYTRAAGKTIVSTFPRSGRCSDYRISFTAFGSVASSQFENFANLYQQLRSQLQ